MSQFENKWLAQLEGLIFKFSNSQIFKLPWQYQGKNKGYESKG